MKRITSKSCRQSSGFFTALALLVLLIGCSRTETDTLQGYVEGEYVYIASPLSGALEELSVQRGQTVRVDDPLFALESEAERAAFAQAAQKLRQGQAQLEDARKGARPSEIASMEAQLKKSLTALELSEKELARQARLLESGGVSEQEFDKAKATRDENQEQVSKLEADLVTAKSGARSDQIAAAQANVQALEAALAKADWSLSQKQQHATQDGLVFDTLYRQGEWVQAGRPVIVLLPPGNILARTFIPERRLGTIQPGNMAQVSVDGIDAPFTGEISFISPRAEYTPPVIYSQENREKLVFMVEIIFEPELAARLHPGQPVDVIFNP